MTLKGQRNHFNVKFLKGYGFSINVKDSKIILKNTSDPFKEPEIEEWYVKNMPYEKIVMSGKGYVSTEALSLLSEHDRNLILLDTYGKPISYLNPVMESLTATKYRMGQYDTFRDESKRSYLARQIVKAKLESQINFLKSTNNQDVIEGITQLESMQNQINDSSPITNEIKASKIYFREFAKLIPVRYEFVARNQSQLRETKSHATDVINALLNYGYTVLAGEISKFINGIGLDAYYGFYHKIHTGFQPLVYDLIEPFRWLVDYSVYKLANSVSRNQTIKKKDYARTGEGSVVMDYNLIRRFLELLERTFQIERRYDFRHGMKTSDGLKSCQESTIAKITVQDLADFCIRKRQTFEV
ncbi:MAG: CRISPR-associated endonuclease Cas1 [Nitrosotalea sp.]